MPTGKLYFQATGGKELSIEVDEGVYRMAADKKISPRDMLNHLAEKKAYESGSIVDQTHGDAFSHMAAATGMFPGKEQSFGRHDMHDLFRADFRAPGETEDSGIAARLLFPQIILEAITLRSKTDAEVTDLIQQVQSMTALTRNVNGEMVQQPYIDVSEPEKASDGRIGQLATPPTMVSITTGQSAQTVPTFSIGLTISDQALQQTTLDLVTLVMQRQAVGQRLRQYKSQLNGLIKGDANLGMNPLQVRTLSSFGGTPGQLNKLAWYKMLRNERYLYSYSHCITTLDSAFAIDNALAPTVIGEDGTRIATPYRAPTFDIQTPRIMDFDEEVLGDATNQLVLLDSRYAMQRIVNVAASYDNVEDYILRRGKAFRVDHGEMLHRLDDEAWLVVNLDA